MLSVSEYSSTDQTFFHSRPDWADDEEFDDPSALPNPTITTNKDGTKTKISYSFNDAGKKVKLTQRIRETVVREAVPPRVAARREWAKFGLEKGHPVGPSFDTTSVGENIIFRPSVTWKRDKQEGKDVKEGDGGVVPGGGIDTNSLKQQLKDKKVKCRICDGEHYTMKCPFKDTLAPDGVDGAVGAAAGAGADGMDGDAAGSKEGGLGSASGVYVPVHLRNKGAATGEKMGGKFERDDLATLRVTNVSPYLGRVHFSNMVRDARKSISADGFLLQHTGIRIRRRERPPRNLRALRSRHPSLPSQRPGNGTSKGFRLHQLPGPGRCCQSV